jgi:hypothetical protein
MPNNKTGVPAVMRRARAFAESGSWDEAIQLLTEANRLSEDGRLETRLVELRHQAFDALARPAPIPNWPLQVPDLFPGTSTVPEIPASELSVELVNSAVQHHGSIIVRGLFEPPACELVRNTIDAAFAGAEAVAGQKEFDPTPWYTHFVQQRKKGYNFGGMERYFVTFGSGVLAVDSPRAMFRYLDCLKAIGFDSFLHEYFGERPALSAKKSTLRRTPPNASSGWHQDGGYFRTEVRALNLWAAFSRCGVDAPSIDMFAKRFDHIVQRGIPGKENSDAVSDENAAQYGLEHAVRLEFEEGDALLFDEMALHRTGVDASMTKTRYAVEMWFFAASMFPHDQVPLYL